MAPRRAGLLAVLAGLILLATAAPAAAQVALGVTAATNYVYRGVTLSDGKPALRLTLALEGGGGFYAGAGLTGALTADSGARIVGDVEYAGYARRLRGDVSGDVGVINTHVSDWYYHHRYAYDATELYAGLRGRWLNTYLYYSPNYYGRGINTLYAQVSGAVHPARAWRLFARAGALTSLGGGAPGVFREQYDLALGVGARLRGLDLQLTWTTRGPDVVYLADHPQPRSTLSLSATHVF